MLSILKAAQEFQRFCDRQGWRSCLIGGLAVSRWGEPRATRDVDVCLWTGFGDEDAYIERLLTRFTPRHAEAEELARIARVFLLTSKHGIGLDVGLAALPFEEECLDRATPFRFAPRVTIRTASAEDLVVMKSLAARPIDWQDIEGILVKQFDHFDWTYVERHLRQLEECFPEADALNRIKALKDDITRRLSRES